MDETSFLHRSTSYKTKLRLIIEHAYSLASVERVSIHECLSVWRPYMLAQSLSKPNRIRATAFVIHSGGFCLKHAGNQNIISPSEYPAGQQSTALTYRYPSVYLTDLRTVHWRIFVLPVHGQGIVMCNIEESIF